MKCKNCGKEYSIPEHFEIDSFEQLMLWEYFDEKATHTRDFNHELVATYVK